MLWEEVLPVWRTCFELAWEAHREGSNPIAAVVADAEGRVVATGKSAVRAQLSGVAVSNCEIAHAEVNALLTLDNRVHSKEKASKYKLYVTLEPCPLCLGALYMSDVNSVSFAAKDRFGGSINLLGSTPYLRRKPTVVEGPLDHLGEISIFLNVYCDVLRGVLMPHVVHEALAVDYPMIVPLAQTLAAKDALGLTNEAQFERVYRRVSDAIAASRR